MSAGISFKSVEEYFEATNMLILTFFFLNLFHYYYYFFFFFGGITPAHAIHCHLTDT